MARRTALASLLFLATTVSVLGQTWHTGDLDEALAVARKEKKLLLVDFYSPSG